MSEGTPNPATWPMCLGPFAYGQATATRIFCPPWLDIGVHHRATPPPGQQAHSGDRQGDAEERRQDGDGRDCAAARIGHDAERTGRDLLRADRLQSVMDRGTRLMLAGDGAFAA